MNLPPSEKIKTVKELQTIARALQASRRTVVFANGCFDLLHAGHIRYLEAARALGDVLILGINSDSSVRRLKGERRPLQSESERAEILASLECVDYVLVFDAPTVDTILLELHPDIHAKGTDYTEESVPERKTVHSYGGRVAIAGDVKHHSSRDLIQSILSRYRT